MSDDELIIKALRAFSGVRLVDLMLDGMTTTEGNQIRRDAEDLADRLEEAMETPDDSA